MMLVKVYVVLLQANRTYDSCWIAAWAVGAFFFFFNDSATTEIFTLSLHDALPIWRATFARAGWRSSTWRCCRARPDRKSTRLNSSHTVISYAVFCLKKKILDVLDSPLLPALSLALFRVRIYRAIG